MYENFYQLQAKPFRLSPDPKFFFASRGHKRALAYLRYGLSQSEGFVVITGAPGTGKTTLAQILLQEMGQSDVVVAHLTTTQLEADEMLRMVLASFGLRYEGQDKAALLKTLEAFFRARSRENKRALLVVDEAQNLPARSLEELRMLSNLQVGEHALLQTFLLGQVQFRQMLDHPDLEQLRQRVIANYHLSALGEDECQNYIESRLINVGWKHNPKFTDEAFEIIHKYTEGVPRRINMLCDRVLLFSSLEEQHIIDANVLKNVTDELQSEISGKPVARPAKMEDRKSTKQDPVVPDVPEESDKTKADKPDQSKVSPSYKPQPEPGYAASATDDAVGSSFSENGGLDIAMPDDGWTRHVAQAQPDNIETDAGSKDDPVKVGTHNNDLAEMERFRVIAGGKDVVESSAAATIESPANQPSSDVMAPLPDAPGDTQEVVLRKILRLVLAFHRSPRSFPGLDDPSQPLPKGIKAILELAIADDQVLSGLRQISVMGISPSMLRAAVRFFVRRVLFLPGGDDFRVLGLASGESLTEVEVHYGLLMKLLRQDKKAHDESGVLRVGEAYERLCRSEITSRPEEPFEIPNDDLSDIVDDAEEDLDLDLSPSVERGANAGFRPAPTSAREVVTNEIRTAPMARNLMLIAGAVVIVFVLYLTQIKTTEKVAPDLVAEGPSEPVVAAVPVTEPKIISDIAQKTTSQFPSVDEAPTVIEIKEEISAEADAREKALIAEQLAFQTEAAAQEKAEAEIQARAEAILKAATLAKLQLEAEINARAEAEARAQADARARTEAKIAAENKRKAAAEKSRVAAKAQADARAKALAAKKAKQKAAVSSVSSANLMSVSNLNKMLTVFTAAYQAGDLNKLLALHSPVVRTNKHIDVAGVRADYQTVFKNSTERSMQFKNISWEQSASYSRGSGQYIIKVGSKGQQPAYEETGDVTLQVENRSGKLRIIRYYASNVTITETVKTQVADSNKTSMSENRISTNELGALLNKLITAYAAGNIETFMQMFAKDAQTSDRATVAGIREDYVGLFKNTSYRTIKFTKMEWTWDGGVARGDGTYDVEVQANGQNKRDHYRGQVWIQLERRGGDVRITHFAFSE